MLQANRYVRSVTDIDPSDLFRWGVRCVLLDRDNTCVPRDADQAPKDVRAWVNLLHGQGISTCLVSNNIFRSEVRRSARELTSSVVAPAFKPAPFAFWYALRKMGVQRHEAVVIGDQLFTDVLAAKCAGIRSILVHPQSTSDLWYTKILRRAEAQLLRTRVFEADDEACDEAGSKPRDSVDESD